MNKKEMREGSQEQMESRLFDARKELFNLKNEFAMTHKLEKPHLLKSLKKEISQLLTLLTERERNEKK